uniref:Uncharacterized protein n=1 Tax=Trichobilharzia regenti TaxID=157069 RepID=A0AA85JLF7_TRIRE|nr:unnamed protein product [Trichobilharzia regenti]
MFLLYSPNALLLEILDFVCEEITRRNMVVGIPVYLNKEFLFRCTFNIHFLFKEFYRASNNLATETLIGRILADIFLAILENRRLKGVVVEVESFYRYMIATFLIMKSGNEAKNIHEDFNKAHTEINLTFRKNRYNNISFLDLLFTREDDCVIKRSKHRKRISTSEYAFEVE